MTTTINADTTNGVKITSDTSGVLGLQTNGNTAISIDANQAVSFTNSANLPNTFGFKNRIINGAMVIDQRNGGAVVNATTAFQYVTDRFAVYASQGSKFTSQQATSTPNYYFSNSLLMTSTSAYSSVSSDEFVLKHAIEGYNVTDLGWGQSGAQSVTLSFWARSSLTGTWSGVVKSSSSNRSFVYTYTINAANTWEFKTVTITGDTTGTWLTNNGIGLQIWWDLGSGSTYRTSSTNTWIGSGVDGATGANSLVGTNGATFYITGVQLEKGATATSFDYRPFGTEVFLCQRYYQSSAYASTSYPSSGGYARAYVSFPVPMRASPTMTFTDLGTGGSSLATGSYTNGYFNTYQSLSASQAGTFSWTATSEL